MKKRRIMILLGLLFCLFSMSGCMTLLAERKPRNPYSTPEGTLAVLEACYNDGNIEGIVDCFDDSMKKVLSGGMKLSTKILSSIVDVDLDYDAMEEILVGLIGLTEIDHGETVRLNVAEKEYSANNTRCAVTVYSYLEGEEENGVSEIINLRKTDNEWKIYIPITEFDF